MKVGITRIIAARCASVGNYCHQLLCSFRSRHVPRRLVHFFIPTRANA